MTTAKFAEICGVTPANIRSLIGSGSIVGEKDGAKGWLVDLDLIENKTYWQEHKKLAKKESQEIAEISQENPQAVEQVQPQNFPDIIANLTQRIEVLAKQAGKAELLTDNLLRKEGDAKFWQDKYFESQAANEDLRNKFSQEKENKSRKSFFGIKYGK